MCIRDRVKEIEREGGKAAFYTMDVTDLEKSGATLDRIVEEQGKLDVFCYNSGIAPVHTVYNVTSEMWDAVNNTNTKAAFFLAQRAIPALKATKGAIVFTSSLVALSAVQSKMCIRDRTGVELSGTVKTPDQAGDVQLKLTRTGEREAAYEVTLSGQAGTTDYSIAQVEAGAYILTVSKEHCAARDYPITVGADPVEQDVELWLLGDVNGDGAVDTFDAVSYTHLIK